MSKTSDYLLACPPGSNGRFAGLAIARLETYMAEGIVESLTRSDHMRDLGEEGPPTERQARAVLVDFLNHLAQPIDLALYDKDLPLLGESGGS